MGGDVIQPLGRVRAKPMVFDGGTLSQSMHVPGSALAECL